MTMEGWMVVRENGGYVDKVSGGRLGGAIKY